MVNWIIMAMSILPVFLEIKFDQWRWSQGKDDKPLSTYLRILVIVELAFITGFMLPGNYWVISLFAGVFYYVTHLLLFNYGLNIIRPDVKLGYRKKGEFWTERSPWYGELFVKLIFYWVGWVLLFHSDWVSGNYPDTLIEFFMF